MLSSSCHFPESCLYPDGHDAVGRGYDMGIGLMCLFLIHFSLANSIFLPLIVGAGVENGTI